MSKILAYAPTYSPTDEASFNFTRPHTRLSNVEIETRLKALGTNSREKPWIYMDAIDSVMNIRPDIKLVVADARSTDSVRKELKEHNAQSNDAYTLAFYTEKSSQWTLLNDVWARFATPDTEYLVYTSSDILWGMDWVAEALKEFKRDPKLQILFPCVNSGDNNLPEQIAPSARDIDLVEVPYQAAARAPVMNAYTIIIRAEFLKAYGGYPTLFRNCFTESFLWYMCEALGGTMKLMPRGWVYHHNGVDSWVGEGGRYHYDAEKELFDKTMDALQEARMNRKMTVEFLKNLLYKA